MPTMLYSLGKNKENGSLQQKRGYFTFLSWAAVICYIFGHKVPIHQYLSMDRILQFDCARCCKPLTLVRVGRDKIKLMEGK